MIRADITRESVNNQIMYEVQVDGHAVTEDGSKGSESVCGAVSCAVLGLDTYLSNSGLDYTSDLDNDGHAHITIRASAPAARLDEIMKLIAISIMQVGISYPEFLKADTFLGVADK